MAAVDLLTEDDPPTPAQLSAWREAAHSGTGTPWLRADQADVLARFALGLGEGVSLMEAVAPRFREPPRDVGWEILGDDPAGENWADHRDPQRAYALLLRKLTQAQADGARLHYKIWLRRAGG
ncbi:hypothetical protein [Tropicibacter oceani]|uniref:Uncharacterized protein n=1 Tax=Tropicibacter oceani TaxID=3058420 RepID=A0ABY8QKB4_9RHOB|nr:hypothetical protein [Tropicibacter oceani]WGW04428.1 hypothetical protein QF118_02465 [Tropicibacter oceani]